MTFIVCFILACLFIAYGIICLTTGGKKDDQ